MDAEIVTSTAKQAHFRGNGFVDTDGIHVVQDA